MNPLTNNEINEHVNNVKEHGYAIMTNAIDDNLLEDIMDTIVKNLKTNKQVKISKFGTFTLRNKKKRIGRNPKTKEKKIISERNVVLFKPSKDFKNLINLKENDET